MTLHKGYIIAICAAILAGLWDVYTRVAIDGFGANPPFYSAVSLLIAAIVLIILAGPGKGGMQTLKSPYTWLFVGFQIFVATFEAYSYIYVTATELNLLVRMSNFISIFLAFAFMARIPKRHDYISCFLMLIGILIIALTLPSDVRVPGVTLVFMTALFFSLRGLVPEIHPVETKTLRSQFRMVGYCLFLTSLCYIGVYALAALIFDRFDMTSSLIPSMEDFTLSASVIAALIAGVLIIPVFFVLSFMANRIVNSETYMTIAILTPITAFITEKVGSHYTSLFNASTIDHFDLISGGFIIAGAIYKIYMDVKIRAIKSK